MNDKKKMKIVIIIIIVLTVVTVGLVLLINGNNEEDNGNNEEVVTSIDNPELRVLKYSDNEFFTVQKIVNNYYEIIKNRDAQEIYNVLDKDYIINNAINESNVLNYYSNNYEDTSYIAKEIQYIEGENSKYYFVNGYLLNQIIVTEEIEYYEDVNYLVVADTKNYLYAIYPLENSKFTDFIDGYDFKNTVELNEDNKYTNLTVTENNKLTTYINEFLSLMFLDSQRAYDMLDSETQKYFGSYDNFNSRLFETYERVSPVIFSYSEEENDGYTLYNVVDNNDNRIKIYEYNTMNYDLGFDFD